MENPLAGKGLTTSICSRSVTLALIGLDSLKPSEALIFWATGFKQIVNSLEQSASPFGKPWLNTIGSEPSCPCNVVATILVFQLLCNLQVTSHNHFGNLCSAICSNFISPNQLWFTESYAFFTLTHAILKLRLLLWQSSVTTLSINTLSTAALSSAPLRPLLFKMLVCETKPTRSKPLVRSIQTSD